MPMKPPAYLDDESGEAGSRPSRAKASLSRELADFLVELSIAMQKHAIYPVGHPLLNTAVDVVMKKVALLLVDRDSLSIGIARKQLIIEGVGTDPNHPLLKELSSRLHKHHLGAIKFGAGLTAEELRDALATIAIEPGRDEDLLGLHAEELSEKWQYVRLYPLNYDRLQLLYSGSDTEGEERILRRGTPKSAQLWVGMARAAMMLDDTAELDERSTHPLVVAEAIDKRQSEQAYDQVIVGYLLQIADELKEQGGTPEAVELQKKISELVRQLSPESIRRLLQMGGDVEQRRNFLLNASQGMTVEAVMELVNASTAQGTQTISHSMMRLFSKLSKYAETDSDPMRRANAEQSMREQMTKLISEWKLDDPNPTAYGQVLQKMSRSRAITSHNPYIDCEPERILQMGFELSTSGPRFEVAMEALLNAARLEQMLNMLDKCADPEFAESVWLMLDSRNILWAALTEARIDFAVLERIVRRKRLSAIEPILDIAERTKDVRQREKLLDLLMELGDDIGPSVVQRLEVTRSDFRRDLFLVVGKLKNIPPGFDASRFLLHTEPQVRREAIRLLLKFLDTREQAIVAALTDSDERAAFYGLQAAQEGGCPPRALPLVRQRLEAGDLDSSLMTLAIRIIAAADSGAGPMLSGQGRTSTVMRAVTADTTPAATAAASKKTMEWLIGRVAKQSRFLKKWELQPKSPEMLAALGALAAYWTMDPTVQEILNLCVKSGDAELKKALGAQRVTGRFKAIDG
jgi:hypothetical protein